RALRRALAAPGPRLVAAAGGAAFLLHNLIDFTAYLPGVAIPSAILLGLSLDADPRPQGKGRALPFLAAAIAAFLLLHGYAWGRAAGLLEEAREAALRGEADSAAEKARAAARARPSDPDPQRFIAEMILAQGLEDPARRALGERSSEKALRLDPESAIAHYTRALYHQAAGEPAPAWRERHAAHLLYPPKTLYPAEAPHPRGPAPPPAGC